MNNFVLSQLLVSIAFACGLVSVQFKARQAVLLCLVASTAFSSTHFFLLERPGPGALLLLTGIRYLVAIKTTDRKALYCFLAVTLAIFASTYQSPLSFLALSGSLIGTYGSFKPLGRSVRLYFMGGNICWLLHNTLAWTPVGMVMEASFLSSSLIGFWRHYGSPFKPATNDQ